MFDAYLSELADEERQALSAVVKQVAAVAPTAEEGLGYGLPAFRYKGKPLLAFAASKNHLGLYPFSPAVLEAMKEPLGGFSLSKGTIRFTPSQPVPPEVLTELVTRRMREIDGTDEA